MPGDDPSGEAPFVDVLVAGAGVVGMACARALQRAGYRVTVADPELPGSGCSRGNAGVMAADHVLPLARCAVLRRLPAMLLERNGPLYLKLHRLPVLLPWFLRFAAACAPAQVAAAASATAALTGRAVAAWEAELQASHALDLLVEHGMYAVYRTARGFRADAGERALARELGVSWHVIDAAELRRREPALSSAPRCAVFYPQVAHVLDPHAVVTRLAAAFAAAGGTIVRAPVSALTGQPHQVTATLQRRRVRARYVVLAAGLATRRLCADLGVHLPLAAEMGYHLDLPEGEPRLNAPVAAPEHGFMVTPMAGRLRLAGTVEFARREAAPCWQRAAVLRELAAPLFRAPLPAAADRWRGSRPTLPDYLPAIGPLPAEPRVIVACGHQHIGLTTAAVTGAMVRAMVQGAGVTPDPAPYAPGRFAGTMRSRPWHGRSALG